MTDPNRVPAPARFSTSASKAFLLASAAVAAISIPSFAAAQDKPAAESDTEVAEVIVTGTLIRGVAPVGTQVVSVGRQDIVESGAQTANQVLATVPQVTSNFNQIRALPTAGSGISNLGPSIRSVGTVPGVAASSGSSTTLV